MKYEPYTFDQLISSPWIPTPRLPDPDRCSLVLRMSSRIGTLSTEFSYHPIFGVHGRLDSYRTASMIGGIACGLLSYWILVEPNSRLTGFPEPKETTEELTPLELCTALIVANGKLGELALGEANPEKELVQILELYEILNKLIKQLRFTDILYCVNCSIERITLSRFMKDRREERAAEWIRLLAQHGKVLVEGLGILYTQHWFTTINKDPEFVKTIAPADKRYIFAKRLGASRKVVYSLVSNEDLLTLGLAQSPKRPDTSQ